MQLYFRHIARRGSRPVRYFSQSLVRPLGAGLLALAACAAAPNAGAAAPRAGTVVTATVDPAGVDTTLSLKALKQRYSDAASRSMVIGGLAIRYKDEGQAGGHDPAIVLLHGSYGSLDGYDALAAALASDHRVIRFDMPGMGLSEGQPVSGSAPTVMGDAVLAAMLDRLGVKQAVLVGTSSGGVIASYYAAAHPERVRALVLANVPSDPVDNANIPRSPALRAEFERAASTGMRDLRYWQVYLEWLQGRPERLTAATVSRYRDMNGREGKSRSAWRSTGKVPEVYATLASIVSPTLLIWGRHDFVLPIHTMRDLEARLPAASVSSIVLDDVGHYPPLEVPERFARILRTYLENVAGGE